MGKFDLVKTKEYITNLRKSCEEIAEWAKGIEREVVELSSKWKDDVYIKTCNALYDLHKSLNVVFDNLAEISNELQDKYVKAYNNYLQQEYSLPTTFSERLFLDNLQECAVKGDSIIDVDSESIYCLAEDLFNYNVFLRESLEKIAVDCVNYGEYYTYPAYEILKNNLYVSIHNAEPIVEEIQKRSYEVLDKADWIKGNLEGN